MGKLGDALRKKFRSPREALRALGLDEKLLDSAQIAFDGDQNMKPTRLEFATLMRTAAAVNPLLAMDAKVEYGPIFKGLTTKNLSARKPAIVAGLRKAVAGRTIAKDASLDHVVKMLDSLEHEPPEDGDESVSEPQHKAMEAAAHGTSTLGIPKSVGEEFARADVGKKFGDMLRDWAKDKGMSAEDMAAIDKMHADCRDEEPDDALDEREEGEEGEHREAEAEETPEERRRSKGEDRRGARDRKGARDRRGARDRHADDRHADDADPDDRDAEDELEEERERADDRRGGRDSRRGARDRRGAMDKRTITQDELNAAIKLERQRSQEALEARQFVEPYVGKLPLALDSAEGVHRAAARALQIENADTVHPSALKQLIGMAGRARAQAHDQTLNYDASLAYDSGSDKAASSFDEMFGTGRIKSVV